MVTVSYFILADHFVDDSFVRARYYKVADWIQFEETETNDEKRLNWFESQANEKETGERNGDDFPV